MKKLIKYVTIATILFSLFYRPSFANAEEVAFKDINNFWAEAEILYLLEQRIIGGYPDGTFKPNQSINRFQAAAMLVKALKIPLTNDTSIHFEDILPESPMYPIAAAVQNANIMNGSKGHFRPGETLSRAQMAAILRRAYNISLTERPYYLDIDADYWAANDINAVSKSGIAGGYPDGTFKPSSPVTRAQFSVFLARSINDDLKLSTPVQKYGLIGNTIKLDGYEYAITNNQFERKHLVTNEVEAIYTPNFKDTEMSKYFHEDSEGGIEMKALPKSFMIHGDNLYYIVGNYNYNGFPNYVQSTLAKIPLSGGLPVPVFNNIFPIDSVEYQNLDGERRSAGEKTIPTRLVRNYHIVDNNIYFISSRQDDAGNTEHIHDWSTLKDQSVSLYRSDIDGSQIEKLFSIKTHIASSHENEPNYNSVTFDRSSLYYSNSEGIYKLNLSTLSTIKISNINTISIEISEDYIVGKDRSGNTFKVKK